MNKMLKGLLVAAMALSAAHVNAHTSKTYLASRPVMMDLAIESATFNELTNEKSKDRWGADFQVTSFYQASRNPLALASYFGVNHNDFFITNNVNNIGCGDVNSTAFMNEVNEAGTARVSLKPTQATYGFRLNYHQDLGIAFDGLYFRVKMPVVMVENNMNLAITGNNTTRFYTYPYGPQGQVGNLTNWFEGFSNQVANWQADAEATGAGLPAAGYALALNAQYGKIANGVQSAGGVADVDVMLGYNLVDNDTYRFALNLGLTIPTGNVPAGVTVFEPIYGNGGHFAFGAGYEFSAEMWNSGHSSIDFNAALDYRYAFASNETRTFGIGATLDENGNPISAVPWGQFYQIGITTENCNAQYFNVAANVTTLQASITPGSMVDAVAGLTYKNGGMVFDVGYNFFFKETGSASINNFIPAGADSAWADNQYSYLQAANAFWVNTGNATTFGVDSASSTAAHGTVFSSPAAAAEGPIRITQAMVDTTSVLASAMTHKVYSQIGYIFKDFACPVFISAGGELEFASNNAAVQTWGINLKTGISF